MYGIRPWEMSKVPIPDMHAINAELRALTDGS